MEGRQVILQVERVDVELGEILCTLVAVSGDMCDGAIDAEVIKAEWGPVKPYRKPDEDMYFDMEKLLAGMTEIKWPR